MIDPQTWRVVATNAGAKSAAFSSTTWDRITDPYTGASGYAADTWISTQYDVKTMVGQC